MCMLHILFPAYAERLLFTTKTSGLRLWIRPHVQQCAAQEATNLHVQKLRSIPLTTVTFYS